MALTLHNLKPAKGAKKKAKRIGRGLGSGHGTYSTRGLKGQRSRTGGKGGLKLKGIKANIQNTPKLGGFRSLKPKLAIVNLVDLENNFSNGDIVTAGKLIEKGLIKSAVNGIKVLGMGKITKKLTVKVNKISQSAKEMVEKAGGQVILSRQFKDKDKQKAKEKNK
jgi:large subunit ribosomal protein L15